MTHPKKRLQNSDSEHCTILHNSNIGMRFCYLNGPMCHCGYKICSRILHNLGITPAPHTYIKVSHLTDYDIISYETYSYRHHMREIQPQIPVYLSTICLFPGTSSPKRNSLFAQVDFCFTWNQCKGELAHYLITIKMIVECNFDIANQ